MPLINGEAVDVDGAVDALPGELRVVVIQFWTKSGTVHEKARRAGCHVDTLYRRLEDAHHRIRSHLAALREAGRRRRAALAQPA